MKPIKIKVKCLVSTCIIETLISKLKSLPALVSSEHDHKQFMHLLFNKFSINHVYIFIKIIEQRTAVEMKKGIYNIVSQIDCEKLNDRGILDRSLQT